MNRRRGSSDVYLRDLIKEAVGLTILLEEWGVLDEKGPRKPDRGRVDRLDPQEVPQWDVGPRGTFSEVGIQVASGKEQDAKATALQAVKDAGGSREDAAEELDVSTKTLDRYANKWPEVKKYINPPGPVPDELNKKKPQKQKSNRDREEEMD